MDYASNTPVSLPIKMDWATDWDLGGGMMWSFEHGFFYEPGDQTQPFQLPTPIDFWGLGG